MVFRPFRAGTVRSLAVLAFGLLVLAGCNASNFPKAQAPVPAALVAKMQQLGMKETSPIFIRIFKQESEFEIWKQRADGQYALLKTYGICKWSGELGPKKKEGDRQAPEGFYTVTPAQMNPNSSYYLSFNIGYPNAFDRSLGRTGANLMVHGACSSAGCYSMTDESAGEIFALARDSFRGGQTSFQIQAFPFRMTPENMAKYRDNPNMDFWRMLKVGYDTFELTRVPPKVDVCNRGYVFNADAGTATFDASGACPAYSQPPALVAALARKKADDDAKMQVAVASLEQQAAKDAADKQAAADRAAEAVRADVARTAEAQKREADRAANPSVIDRLLSRVGLGPKAPDASAAPAAPADSPAAAKTANAPMSVPKPKPAPVAVAEPVPQPAPKVVAPPPSPAATPAPPATAADDSGKITPAMTPQSPPVGTFVKKKFDWPDDSPSAGSDTSG